MFDVASDQTAQSTGDCWLAHAPIDARRWSRPAPGRSLGGAVTRIEPPIRESIEILVRPSTPDRKAAAAIFNCTVYGPAAVREPDDVRLAWFVVSVAITHSILLKQWHVAGLSASLEWFFQDNQIAERLMACFSPPQIAAAEGKLALLAVTEELHDLLPYLLEPHGHVTRSRRENCAKARHTRNAKKNDGVYYTPSDVADFMVGSLAALPGVRRTWIDPACGTGVFLRSMIAHQRDSGMGTDELFAFTVGCLFGVDKSALSTDLAAFIVLIECARDCTKDLAPFAVWQRIKQHIACMDSLRLTPSANLTGLYQDAERQATVQEIFPEVVEGVFDHVVMNPPYASAKIDGILKTAWHSFSEIPVGQSGDIHLAFTEMLWRLTSDYGVSSAVLPLSVGTNTTRAYVNLRRELLASTGGKDFLFFDREPQALFGEDIKTRSLILMRNGLDATSSVRTSRLLKWTAEQRSTIFARDRLVSIDDGGVFAFIPKLGSHDEVKAYSRLHSAVIKSSATRHAPNVSRVGLDAAIVADSELQGRTLLISSTAYNFINAFFASALPASAPRPYSQSPINALYLDSAEDAYAALAILTSRLSFWLWHVEGDGFHLTGNFLNRLPLWAVLDSPDNKRRLAVLGRELWGIAKGCMLGAINGGKQTYSFYCSYDHPIVTAVENELIQHLGLDAEFSATLDAFIHATVSIDGKSRARRVN